MQLPPAIKYLLARFGKPTDDLSLPSGITFEDLVKVLNNNYGLGIGELNPPTRAAVDEVLENDGVILIDNPNTQRVIRVDRIDGKYQMQMGRSSEISVDELEQSLKHPLFRVWYSFGY